MECPSVQGSQSHEVASGLNEQETRGCQVGPTDCPVSSQCQELETMKPA